LGDLCVPKCRILDNVILVLRQNQVLSTERGKGFIYRNRRAHIFD